MNQDWQALRINKERFLSDFAELSQIGATGDGGVHRPALNAADLQAREWLRAKARAAGLETRTDSAGSVSVILECGPQGAPTLLLGSHLDSVPYGGRFDGALGVLSALEAVRVAKEQGLRLPYHLEAIDFTDEEGTLVGLIGSGAISGHLPAEALANARGGREEIAVVFAAAGLDAERVLEARRIPTTLAGYFELHIEQGPKLETAQANIGVVTSIVGINSYRVRFMGRADHAGTSSMKGRLDAGQGASAFNLAARELVLREYPDCVVNIGQMIFAPGAFNIVPREAEVSLEFRSADLAELQRLELDLLKLARNQANRFGLGLAAEPLWLEKPARMDERNRAAITSAAEGLGLSHMAIPSGAGHDAQMMATICPSGMIFVPSVDGASHSPRELTRDEDCVNGANTLLQAALRFASE